MNKVTIQDIKQAVWKKEFRDLFPEYQEALDKYLKDPGCACNLSLVRSLMQYKDRIKQFFPGKEVVPPEEEPPVPNEWAVINCPINQLEDRMRRLPAGKRMVCMARWQDRVTVILNDIHAHLYVPARPGNMADHVKEAKETKLKWQVVNTTTQELIHELRKLAQGRKQMVVSRWRDQITLVVWDMGVLF